jgi:hypothetical protein
MYSNNTVPDFNECKGNTYCDTLTPRAGLFMGDNVTIHTISGNAQNKNPTHRRVSWVFYLTINL